MSDNSDEVEKRRGRRIAFVVIFCLFALLFVPLILGGLHNWLGPSKILTALITVVFGFISVLWLIGSIPDMSGIKESWDRGKLLREQAAKAKADSKQATPKSN
jgi:hypothetical protein